MARRLIPILLILPFLLPMYVHPSSTQKEPEPTIVENSQGGKVLILSNGISYQIKPEDVNITSIWVLPCHIKIEYVKQDAPFPYRLTNTTTGTTVSAQKKPPEKPSSQPTPHTKPPSTQS